MSDEMRPEVEAKVHPSVALEDTALSNPEPDATVDEEPDFEAHGPVGLGPGAMGPAMEGPTVG